MRALLRPGGCVPATPGAAPQPADAGLVANRALLLVHEHQPPEVALVRDVGGSRISVSQWPGVAPSRRAIIFPTSASGESCGVRCEHRAWHAEPASFRSVLAAPPGCCLPADASVTSHMETGGNYRCGRRGRPGVSTKTEGRQEGSFQREDQRDGSPYLGVSRAEAPQLEQSCWSGGDRCPSALGKDYADSCPGGVWTRFSTSATSPCAGHCPGKVGLLDGRLTD